MTYPPLRGLAWPPPNLRIAARPQRGLRGLFFVGALS